MQSLNSWYDISNNSFPQVIPKPVLPLLDLSVPLASSDLGAGNLEKLVFMQQHPALPGDKLVRAIELVKLHSHEKSVRGAIKLVTALKLPNLAERFNTILEERLLKEIKETPVLLPTNSNPYTPNR